MSGFRFARRRLSTRAETTLGESRRAHITRPRSPQAALVKYRGPRRYWKSAITLAKGAMKMKLNFPARFARARQDPT
jgi:hypothetical protein